VTGYIPLRTSSVEMLQGEGWFEANPNSTVAYDQLAQSSQTTATAGALLGSFPAIRNLVTQAIDTVLLSDTSPEDALAQAAAAANTSIEEYNLLNAE
jgi:sn-glycerol 3-phosphate transport system substrate-binding protein